MHECPHHKRNTCCSCIYECVFEADGREDAHDWHSLARHRKQRAGLFVCCEGLLEGLVTTYTVISVGMMLLYKVLRLSSQKWEDEQAHIAAKGEHRSYIVLEVAKGTCLAAAWEQVQQQMWSIPKALPALSFTYRARAKLFCMLSGLVCNLEAACGRFHRTFPFLLFKILEGIEQSKVVYNAPHCTRDEMAKSFFDLYPTPQSSQSPEAIAWLQAAALFSHVDIADVECGHSSIREFTKQRGRGHVPDFSGVSCRVMCRFLSKQTNIKAQEQDQKQEEQEQEQQGQNKKKKVQRPGSGGAWRSFCKEKAGGKQFTPVLLKQLSAEYKALSHDEYQHYKELGLAMTVQGSWKKLRESQASLSLFPTAADTADFSRGLEMVSTVPTAALLDLDETTSFQLLSLGPTFEERLDSLWKNMSLERRNLNAEKKLRLIWFLRFLHLPS